jgi:hypothetical protein
MRSLALMMSGITVAAQAGARLTGLGLELRLGDLQDMWDGETWRPLFRIMGRVSHRFAIGNSFLVLSTCSLLRI